MKTKHIFIFLVLFGSIYYFGQSYKPNKFTAKKYEKSGLPGHADFLLDTIKKYSEDQAKGSNPELSIKIALSMRDFEEIYPSEFAEVIKETNSIDLAKKLKSSANFKRIAKKRELDLSKVYYVSR